MSRKSKGSTDKKEWQKVFIKWYIGKTFNNDDLYGFHAWPQAGPVTTIGQLKVHGECGAHVMDPATVEGTRIIRNIKLRVIQGTNSIYKDLGIFIYKYNYAYGGNPCCDYEPTPNEDVLNPTQAHYCIQNYQNMIGQCVFHKNDTTEHEINIEGEYLMESGDTINVSCGNMEMFGSVAGSGNNWTKVTEKVSGHIIIAGIIEFEIAFV